jgi:hypothetical protein
MSVMLYCILAGTPLPPPPDDDLPEAISAVGLTALVTRAPSPSGDVDAMLAFGRVIEHYHRQRTLIPMRYGCRLPDRAAVGAHLAQHRDRYRTLLDELADAVEMSVRLPLPSPAADAGPNGPPAPVESPDAGAATQPPTHTGRAYLQRRRATFAATDVADARAQRLEQVLIPHCRRHHRESGRFAGRMMISIHCLVARSDLAAFRGALAQALANADYNGVLTSGPWPPYAFAAMATAGNEAP